MTEKDNQQDETLRREAELEMEALYQLLSEKMKNGTLLPEGMNPKKK